MAFPFLQAGQQCPNKAIAMIQPGIRLLLFHAHTQRLEGKDIPMAGTEVTALTLKSADSSFCLNYQSILKN